MRSLRAPAPSAHQCYVPNASRGGRWEGGSCPLGLLGTSASWSGMDGALGASSRRTRPGPQAATVWCAAIAELAQCHRRTRAPPRSCSRARLSCAAAAGPALNGGGAGRAGAVRGAAPASQGLRRWSTLRFDQVPSHSCIYPTADTPLTTCHAAPHMPESLARPRGSERSAPVLRPAPAPRLPELAGREPAV